MNVKARDELRAQMIDFACRIDEEDLDDEAFAGAIIAFLARQARLYGCSPRAIREHYVSEIDALGPDEYFFGFRPELS